MRVNSKLAIVIALIIAVCVFSVSLSYAEDTKLDINQLTDKQLTAELVSIKGIGQVTAQRIIKYRQENKPVTVDELDAIKGIGEKRLTLIRKKFR